MMDDSCLLDVGTSVYEEKKSVFYGMAIPVKTEDEVKKKLEEIKKKYSDANHHVYAYVLRDNHLSRYTDDSEPQGTAGLPILSMIQAKHLSDILVVVTRYFGGTLLGTGGLTRAYGTAAKEAIENGGIGELVSFSMVSMSLSYSDYQKISSVLSRLGAKEEEALFGTDVSLIVSLQSDKEELLNKLVAENTSGRCSCEKLGERLVPQKK